MLKTTLIKSRINLRFAIRKGFLYFQNASERIIFEEYVDDLFKVSKKIFNSKSKKFIEIQNEVEQITYELTGN